MQKALLQRFVSDQKIPIALLDEPYFSYFLDLYEKDFGTRQKYQAFEKEVSGFPCEQDFLEEYHRVRDRMITETEARDAYKRFLDCDMEAYDIKVPALTNGSRDNVYRMCNVGKHFLSIDLRKANFQVLRKFDPEIVKRSETYEDWVSTFTNSDYIKSSKYLRQVVFGKLCSERQVAMERFYIKQVLDFLLEREVSMDDIAVFTTDEIVLHLDREDYPVKAEGLRQLEEMIRERTSLDVSATSFLLNSVGGKDWFVKEKSDGGIELKKVPTTFFPQAYKAYRGLPVNDYDLTFLFEGQKAKFIAPAISSPA